MKPMCFYIWTWAFGKSTTQMLLHILCCVSAFLIQLNQVSFFSLKVSERLTVDLGRLRLQWLTAHLMTMSTNIPHQTIWIVLYFRMNYSQGFMIAPPELNDSIGFPKLNQGISSLIEGGGLKCKSSQKLKQASSTQSRYSLRAFHSLLADGWLQHI